MTTKELLEVIILVIGGGGGAAGAGFAFATIQAQTKLDKLIIDLKDEQIKFSEKLHHSIAAGQLEFARKVSQNIESNRVSIGQLKCDVEDIKGVLERDQKMHPRRGFPPENIPPHTDFT